MPTTSQPRVLVIDDDRVIRMIVTEALAKAGCEVVEAADGDVGLTAMQEHPPDLVILDIMLPRMDGLSVLAAMRDLQLTVPVLVFSATGSSNAERARTMGASAFLAKPFDLGELQRTVRQLLAASDAA